jgi:hypothetical protein
MQRRLLSAATTLLPSNRSCINTEVKAASAGGCFDFYSCGIAFSDGQQLNPPVSSTVPHYSKAEAWFPVGTHTVLIRQEMPHGCGSTGNEHWLTGGSCYGAGNVGWRLWQGVYV